MTNNKDLPDNLDEAKGRAKQAVGQLTGDEELEREGETDEAAGKVKEVVDGAADAVRGAIDDVRKKL